MVPFRAVRSRAARIAPPLAASAGPRPRGVPAQEELMLLVPHNNTTKRVRAAPGRARPGCEKAWVQKSARGGRKQRYPTTQTFFRPTLLDHHARARIGSSRALARRTTSSSSRLTRSPRANPGGRPVTGTPSPAPRQVGHICEGGTPPTPPSALVDATGTRGSRIHHPGLPA